jgi:hypothetical protein
MKTFQQFLSMKSNEPILRGIARDLLESGIDPVRYVYLRLHEDMSPPQAATAASMPGAPPAPQTAPQSQPAGGAKSDFEQQIRDIQGKIEELLKQGSNNPDVQNQIARFQEEAKNLASMHRNQAQQQPKSPMQPGQQQQPQALGNLPQQQPNQMAQPSMPMQ